MNTIWRFHRDPQHEWHWQQLSPTQDVLATSTTGHQQYEQCLADAEAHGYVHHVAQPGMRVTQQKNASGESAAAAAKAKAKS